MFTCRRIASLWFCLAAWSCLAAGPADVPLHDAGRGNWLIVTLRLEDGTKVPCVVDTGASATLIDNSLKSKLGEPLGTTTLDHWGHRENTQVYPMPKLRLENVQLETGTNIFTGSLKLMSLVARQTVRGILGMDCLHNYCIQLDFTAGEMRFLDPDHLDTTNLGRAYPLGYERNRPVIHHTGLFGGTSTNALIDTGMMYDAQVEQVVVQGHSLIRFRNFLIEHVPFARKLHRHFIAPACTWDGGNYTNLKVDTGVYANVLGLRFLARHLVTFDFPHNVMYLKQVTSGPRQ